MKRIVELNGSNGNEIIFSRLEYLPIASMEVELFEIKATDDIANYVKLLDKLSKGDSMRQVKLGDDNDSISFTLNEDESKVELTMQHGNGTKVTDTYDIEELVVALRFITDGFNENN